MSDERAPQGLGEASGTGSHASHEAPAGLRPSGFDPSRIMQDFYLSRYYEPKPDRPADNVQAAIEYVFDLYVRPQQDAAKDLYDWAIWAARRLEPTGLHRTLIGRANAAARRAGVEPTVETPLRARPAQGIAARSDETAQQAQPEGQEPGPKDAPVTPCKEPKA